MRDKLIDITMASELIICLVLPVLCSILVLQWQRDQIYWKIKSERIAWASPEEMICLKFSSSNKPQIKGKKSSQTIDHLGDSYHIVQTETVGDTTFFWCLSELNTTDLTEAYEDLLARELGQSSQRQKQKSLLFNYFQSLYFEIIVIELYESFAYLEGDKFHENTLAYTQPFSSPTAPPPKS